MTQAKRLEKAKDVTVERLGDKLMEFDKFDDYKWMSLEEVDGQEVWTVISITAKKSFDPDEEIENYEVKCQEREARAKKARLNKEKRLSADK